MRTLAVRVVAAGLMALTAALVGVTWWWTHPSHFHDAGDGFAAEPRPVAESAVHMGLVIPEPGSDEAVVTLRNLVAHFNSDAKGAVATFSVCHLGGRDPLAYVRGPLARHCAAVTPVADGTGFRHAPGSDQVLVMTVAPTRPGLSHVDSVTIDYALGRAGLWRRGSQTIAVDLTVVAE